MSLCRAISCVVERRCSLWPACSLDKTLLAFALLHFIFQGQTCLVSEYLLTSCFCIPVPYDENDIFFGISSGKFCVLRVPECACSVVSDSLRSPGLASLRNSPGKNTGAGHCVLLQRIFLTRGSNPCLLHLLHWKADSLPLSHLGSP